MSTVAAIGSAGLLSGAQGVAFAGCYVMAKLSGGHGDPGSSFVAFSPFYPPAFVSSCRGCSGLSCTRCPHMRLRGATGSSVSSSAPGTSASSNHGDRPPSWWRLR